MHAGRFRLADAGQKLFHERPVEVRLQGGTRRVADVEERGGQSVPGQQRLDFAADARLRFTGNQAAIDADAAIVRDNVRLGTAGDGADADRRMPKQSMPSLAQPRGIGRLEQIHDAGHGVDGVAAQFRTGAVRRLAPRLQLQP